MAALLAGTALLFSGLTAAAITMTGSTSQSPPVATRAPATSSPPLAPLRTPVTIDPPVTAPATSQPVTAPTTSQPATAATPAVLAPPVAVDIPAIKVRASVDPMGLTAEGKLAVPTKFERVGWWSGGPKPGEQGSSVLEGHVDSTKGPAVFYGLRLLRAGDEVRVVRSDLSSAIFVVDRLSSFSKDDFPTSDVYGPTEGSALRLITCTGSFDRKRGSYQDNLVVFANLKT